MKREMHLAINTLFLIPGEVGGSETYFRETVRAIAKHHSDIRLTLFTNLENDASMRELLSDYTETRFERLNFRATNRYARIIREQTELPRRVTKSGCDILWSPGYTAAVMAPCPQALTIHDMQYKRFPEDLTWLARLTTHLLVQAGVRRCKVILTPSEFARQEVAQFTGANPDRLRVTPEAADPAFAATPPGPGGSPRLAALLNGAGPYVLTVGHSYPHKNLHALVEAFDAICESREHRLVIVGKARLGEPRLQEALRNAKHTERVVRLSGVAFEDLVLLYQGAALFAFPSLYEGFGLPVLEAMTAGTPVIAAREASIPEVGGDSITYFDPNTPGDLERMLNTVLDMAPAQLDAIVSAAREHARGFSWQKTAAATVDALRSIVAGQ